MSFGVDHGIWYALATPVVLASLLALAGALRRRQLARVGGPLLRQMMASLSPRRRRLRAGLWIAAITLLVTAMARPQVQGASTWRQRGIDLVVVMDFSKSMLASDVYPTRLDRMKHEVEALLDALQSDRVAVVVFAGAAAYFPLTRDREAARSLFRGLSPVDVPPGSDLGEAIMVARCVARPGMMGDPDCRGIAGRGAARRARIEAHADDDNRLGEPRLVPPTENDTDPETGDANAAGTDAALADRARAIVVFTDGEDTAGRARVELQRAVDLGVHVFLVGVGTPTGELVPELDDKGERLGWKKSDDGKSFITTRLDEDRLRELATIAGGPDRLFILDPKQFRAADLLAQLQRLERGDLDARLIERPRQVYDWFLFPAFLLLVLELCISERRRRVIP